ncbi:GAF domain-containing protein [Ottowia sp.]|uniref:GAF domain-containing protein n=1 Tax=Ottowia sp. TaxID=1898956 RepID=UPI002BC3AFDB|nr:GAF domain-containing protein [Ottowia sp.]HOB67442.1 GAF domain-containing protein [Ottowia sp.]HPZ56561.1 GAF domain-containing protein [Ottowia sp.]HQD46868.1 GAF domain-containing protein [Ottowia sp.]
MLGWFGRKRNASSEARVPVGAAVGVDPAAAQEPDAWQDTLPLHLTDAPEAADSPLAEAQPTPAACQWAPHDARPAAAPTPTSALADSAEAEQRRVAALDAHGDAAYQYVAEAAVRICQTPIAAITLFGGGELRLEAGVGVSAERATALALACDDIAQPRARMTVLRDVVHDPRFSTPVPALAREGIRSYAAVPLTTAQGVGIGTLWVADRQPRDFTPVQLRTLQLLARQTALLLGARAQTSR